MPESVAHTEGATDAGHVGRTGRAGPSRGRGALVGRIPRLGIWAWSFVGLVAATVIVVGALAAVSEIVLPLTFAAVLAVIFKPLVDVLQRHRFKPALAAGLVVLGLLAIATGVVVATVRGVTGQADQIGASVDAALDHAVTAWVSIRPRWTRPGPRCRPPARRSPPVS